MYKLRKLRVLRSSIHEEIEVKSQFLYFSLILRKDSLVLFSIYGLNLGPSTRCLGCKIGTVKTMGDYRTPPGRRGLMSTPSSPTVSNLS